CSRSTDRKCRATYARPERCRRRARRGTPAGRTRAYPRRAAFASSCDPVGEVRAPAPACPARRARPAAPAYTIGPMLPPTIVEAARRFADRTAYVTPTGWALSYADVDRISDEVAVGLAARGVVQGDVVGLVLAPGPEYLLAYCAAAKVGAITAGVNDRLSERERFAVLDVASPRVVLDAQEFPAAESPDKVLAALRVPGKGPTPLPDDPDRPVA